MKKPSWIVTEHDARARQMGERCFYCPSPIGTEHAPRCVCRMRTVVVKLTIETVIARPEDWDVQMVNFHMNESSSCATNLIDDLTRLSDADFCFCGSVEAEYVREATQEDHENLLPKGFDLLADSVPTPPPPGGERELPRLYPHDSCTTGCLLCRLEFVESAALSAIDQLQDPYGKDEPDRHWKEALATLRRIVHPAPPEAKRVPRGVAKGGE